MKTEELKHLEKILAHMKYEAESDCYYFNEEDVKLMEKTIEFLYGEC